MSLLPIRFTFGHRPLVSLLCDSRKPSQTVHGVPQLCPKIGSTAIAFSLARLLSSFSETDGYDSPTAYGNNYSHGWTRPLLDLSAYAGQTVQLSFYLYTRDLVGGDDTGPGWYIDEVLVETGAYVYNNPEDSPRRPFAVAVAKMPVGFPVLIRVPCPLQKLHPS